MTSHSIPFSSRLVSEDHPNDAERKVREEQTVGTLIRARLVQETEKTEALFARWRRQGSPIERDIFPAAKPDDLNGATT